MILIFDKNVDTILTENFGKKRIKTEVENAKSSEEIEQLKKNFGKFNKQFGQYKEDIAKYIELNKVLKSNR